jgi:kynurenine formamidase
MTGRERQTGVRYAGDALFVRTGVWARRKALGPWLRGRAEGGRSAGLDPSVIPWLKQRDIALLGSDHPQYVSPSNLKGAVHDFALLYLGVHLFDNLDLEALGDAAASRRRWDFLLTAAPLPIIGGTCSPLNPIATFLGLIAEAFGRSGPKFPSGEPAGNDRTDLDRRR